MFSWLALASFALNGFFFLTSRVILWFLSYSDFQASSKLGRLFFHGQIGLWSSILLISQFGSLRKFDVDLATVSKYYYLRLEPLSIQISNRARGFLHFPKFSLIFDIDRYWKIYKMYAEEFEDVSLNYCNMLHVIQNF